mmetsp:Transcript_45883/g.55201  ORF Transcript_45883/g.55201 Transcript_45883/m.55201 type:complete len:612 (+) Transcript_45883:194-2029(+)
MVRKHSLKPRLLKPRPGSIFTDHNSKNYNYNREGDLLPPQPLPERPPQHCENHRQIRGLISAQTVSYFQNTHHGNSDHEYERDYERDDEHERDYNGYSQSHDSERRMESYSTSRTPKASNLEDDNHRSRSSRDKRHSSSGKHRSKSRGSDRDKDRSNSKSRQQPSSRSSPRSSSRSSPRKPGASGRTSSGRGSGRSSGRSSGRGSSRSNRRSYSSDESSEAPRRSSRSNRRSGNYDEYSSDSSSESDSQYTYDTNPDDCTTDSDNTDEAYYSEYSRGKDGRDKRGVSSSGRKKSEKSYEESFTDESMTDDSRKRSSRRSKGTRTSSRSRSKYQSRSISSDEEREKSKRSSHGRKSTSPRRKTTSNSGNGNSAKKNATKGAATDKYDTYSKSKSSRNSNQDPKEKERTPVRGNSKSALGSSVSGDQQSQILQDLHIKSPPVATRTTDSGMVRAGSVKNLFDKGASNSSPQGLPPTRSKLQKMKTKLSSKVTTTFKPKKSKTTIGAMISSHPQHSQNLHASDLTDDGSIVTTHTTGTVGSSSVYIQGRQGEIKLQKFDNGSAVYYPDPNHDEGGGVMCVLAPVPIPMLNNSSDLVLIKVQVRPNTLIVYGCFA